MSATVTELPRPRPRAFRPMLILMKSREAALALGGTGELISSRPTPYYRCRCPLCDSPMRLADQTSISIVLDCQSGCAPQRVVAELIRRGLFTCRDVSRPDTWR